MHVSTSFEELLFPSFAIEAEDAVFYKICVALTIVAWGCECRQSMEETETIHGQLTIPALIEKVVVPRVLTSHELCQWPK